MNSSPQLSQTCAGTSLNNKVVRSRSSVTLAKPGRVWPHLQIGQIIGIMEQPPRAPDPLLDENGPVFNEQEHFQWQRATWLRP